MSASSPIFYRFRATSALLGERQELARQEIYFASKDELNDPLEGYTNVAWQGDAILWRNLLRHYLLLLSEMVTRAAVLGEEFDDAKLGELAFMADEDLPDAPIRRIYAEICDRFFQHRISNDWVEGLTSRNAILTREELAGYLRILHFHALNTVLRAYQDEGLPTFLGQLDFSEKYLSMAEQLGAWLQIQEEGQEKREILHYVMENTHLQMDLISDFTTPIGPEKRGWVFLLKDFPAAYVRAIEGTLYPEWRTACFVTDPTHASMWGVYADGQKGVCLALRSHSESEGQPTLRLHGAFGQSAGSQGVEPCFANAALAFVPVRYENVYPPTDFFRSLGRLSRSKLEKFWYSDASGARSPRILDIIAEDAAWRDGYWAQAGKIVSTKLPQWEHEGEHRLVAQGHRKTVKERLFRYRLEDLDGVIFGMKTSRSDKHDIIRTLAASAARQGVAADTIRFSQAEFSRTQGRIVIQTLSLLNGQFPKLVEAYAKMPEVMMQQDLEHVPPA